MAPAELDLDGPHAIGKYQAGCLYESAALPQYGHGYQTMKLSRYRFFGHPEMIDYLYKYGERLRDAGLGDMLIGDISKRKGGPFRYGHASHQTGLDVDVWFRQAPKDKRYTRREKEDMVAWDYVTIRNREMFLTRGWTNKKDQLIRLATQDDRVTRIFVSPAVKRRLCRRFPGEEWLRKVRPWWYHRDHLHVRIRCPKSSTRCIAQPPVPPGTGCGEELDWWFSKEAWDIRDGFRRNPRPPRQRPVLPKICDQVLDG